MKLMIVLEVDVSTTIAESMQRNGFTLAPDGTAMKVKVANCPSIPQRKTHVAFIENPLVGIQQLMSQQKPDSNAGDTTNVSNDRPTV